MREEWKNDQHIHPSTHPSIITGYGTTCSIGANLGFLQQNPKHKVLEDLLPANIVDVAFGSDHAIALTAEGKLFSWGSSKWGQVGLGAAPQNPLKPVMIKGGLSDKVREEGERK